jgi:hypothetical protein
MWPWLIAIYAFGPALVSPLNNYAILASLVTAEAPHRLLCHRHVEVDIQAEQPVFFLAISNNFPIMLAVLYPGRHGTMTEVQQLIYATA